jgi:acyl carrier protein
MSDALTGCITDIVKRLLPPDQRDALVTPETPLATVGIKSLTLVELICALEESLGITLSSDMLDDDSFRTVESIVSVVARASEVERLAAQPPSDRRGE